MPVVWIGQGQPDHKLRVRLHQTVRNDAIHSIGCPVNLLPGEVWTVDQQIARPLLMNVLTPARPKSS